MKRIAALIICIVLLSGCAPATMRGRTKAQWSPRACMELQTKRDALIGSTSGMAVLAGGAGLGTAFPDTQEKRASLGVIAAVAAVAAAVMAPFISSAAEDYNDHCTSDKGEK